MTVESKYQVKVRGIISNQTNMSFDFFPYAYNNCHWTGQDWQSRSCIGRLVMAKRMYVFGEFQPPQAYERPPLAFCEFCYKQMAPHVLRHHGIPKERA